MLKHYMMILAATVLFSVQFVFTKYYQKIKGAGLFYSLMFSAMICLASVPFFIIMNNGKFEFSVFSFIIALMYALDAILCTVFGVKALSCADLSVYSLFLMLGGMLLPFAYGLFRGETLTWLKVVAVTLVFAAMLAATPKKRKERKKNAMAIVCFVSIFITNGLTGVLTFVHQRSAAQTVSASGFLLLCNCLRFFLSSALALCVFIYIKRKKKNATYDRSDDGTIAGAGLDGARKKITIKSWLLAFAVSGGYAIVHSAASLLTTITAGYVDAGVQSTIVTGGCMAMSAVYGLMFGEKITKRTALSLLLALIGTGCMMM
ncbi:MAG: hypothetical protein SPH68_01125 [Candidatus Borkfalkiaceae bacterium]|nr:hypothetical protein [Clostridia bacterium]MDY6222746.1 hypothetical protein [Christensenellaceae bacterium]